jgi:hypothetical protein
MKSLTIIWKVVLNILSLSIIIKRKIMQPENEIKEICSNYVHEELNREEWQDIAFDDDEIRDMMERAFMAGYELALLKK